MKKIPLYIMAIAVFFAACDSMKKEIDIDSATFPPKLCVTAILDGASGVFSIALSEGRTLADYKTPLPYDRKITTNGEIRLYEDDRLILSEAGAFDLTQSYREPYFDWNDTVLIYPEKDGYRFEAPVAANPGSIYRIEIETDRYETVTSVSAMPSLPDISATVDTGITVKMTEKIKNYQSLGGWYSGSSNHSDYYHPVSLQWGVSAAGRNYYALEMHEDKTVIEGTPNEWNPEKRTNIGIYVTDLSKLQDNPEVEIYEAQDIDLEASSRDYDMYRFPILLMSDIGFTSGNASLTLYKTHNFDLTDEDLERFQQLYPPDTQKLILFNHTVTLRVRHITEATFRYYRSMAMQSQGVDFFTEPVNIISNIENGYGGFMVFSAIDFKLGEYKSFDLRLK